MEPGRNVPPHWRTCWCRARKVAADRRDRADHRRERAPGRRCVARSDPRGERAERPTDDPRELRGHAARALRERVLRPRARRVHGRAGRPDGRFAAADGGTLFLDEVARSRPSSRQAPARAPGRRVRARRRERAAPRGRARRRGDEPGSRGGAAARGTFREDLYYRLDVFPIADAAAPRAPGRHARCSRVTSSAARRRAPSGGSRPRTSRGSRPTRGPATCASSRT